MIAKQKGTQKQCTIKHGTNTEPHSSSNTQQQNKNHRTSALEGTAASKPLVPLMHFNDAESSP